MGFAVTRSALPAAAIVACILCSSASVLAAPHPPAAPTKESSPEKTRAADLFKKSADAYLKGDFAQAIAYLDEAYTLDPQPVLLYNMARAHEGLGHLDEAITLYERYLTQEPTSPDRGAIEQRITTLKKQRDEKAALAKERAQVEKDRAAVERDRAAGPPPPPPPPRPRSIYPYAVAGAGVVGLLTGTVFGLLANSKKNEATDEKTQTTAIDIRSTGKSFATVSNVSFIVGGALVAGGVVWWVVDGQQRQTGAASGTRVGVGVGPGYVGIGGSL
jgi:hypothetical protein